MTTIADNISRLFTSSSDPAGEFGLCDPAHPFSVAQPTTSCARFVYTTKPQLVSSALSKLDGNDLGLIGRSGLPRDSDIALIRNVVQGHALVFLGDLDVADLLVFAWLRDRLASMAPTYVGLNDAFFAKAEWFPTDTWYVAFSKAEEPVYQDIQRFLPDFTELVGPNCAAVLNGGGKIELEAAFHANEMDAIAVLRAIQS